jgi:hypothetical protein
VHLEAKPPKTGFGGAIKDVLSGLIEGNSKFAGWMADSFMGRDTTQNTGSPFWDGVTNSTFAGRVFSATVDDMFASSDRRKAKKLKDRNMQ